MSHLSSPQENSLVNDSSVLLNRSTATGRASNQTSFQHLGYNIGQRRYLYYSWDISVLSEILLNYENFHRVLLYAAFAAISLMP